MDLILWRHAEAEDAGPNGDDMARALTARGEKQARRMAAWLNRHLPDRARILCSPALRAEQTASALKRPFELRDELAPTGTAAQVLKLAQWPVAQVTIVLVGHQPVLGQVIARVLRFEEPECTVRKGAVWWLAWRRGQDGRARTSVVTVQSPQRL